MTASRHGTRGPTSRPRPPRRPAPDAASRVDAVIGQSTAVIAVLGSALYAAGALTLGLKLWFVKVPWTPVLGQLPHGFILTTAFAEIIAPTALAGIVVGSVIDLGHKRRCRALPWHWTKQRWYSVAGYDLAIAAVLAGVPIGLLQLTTRGYLPGVLRSQWQNFALCWAFSAATVAALHAGMHWIYVSSGKSPHVSRRWAIALTALSLIPLVASICATPLLPNVTICGARLATPNGPSTYIRGGLIGDDNQHLYLAYFVATKRGTPQARVQDDLITVVPTSAIQLEIIGSHGTCG